LGRWGQQQQQFALFLRLWAQFKFFESLKLITLVEFIPQQFLPFQRWRAQRLSLTPLPPFAVDRSAIQ
jgi:hypothetical protein